MDIIGDCSKKHDSSLPWIWIVEYLSGFKEFDTFILKELVAMVPDDLPDELVDKIKEVVALRCLEDLVDFAIASEDDDVRNKIEFDLSASCEDVLQQIVQKADLSMAGPEVLKWDVRPFIRHKKDMRPKCALQKLKDMVLDDSVPLAASLRAADCSRSDVDDVFHNAPTPGHISHTENVLPSKRNIVDLTSDECRDHLTNSNKLKKDNFGPSHSSHDDMQKSNFLFSQLGLRGGDGDTLTEKNVCVKCNKDGQLLFCSTSSCPLVLHEHCLGSPANFDENGKFYCPFCSCSLATSAYLEAKKKVVSARKELAAFIGMGSEHRHRGT